MNGRTERAGLVVLISGTGRNLQAMIDAVADGHLAADIRGVVSSRADAFGLIRAARADIPSAVIRPKDHPDRRTYDAALAEAVDRFRPDIVALAGFVRILGSEFVQHYLGRLVNIHPSLLPRYRGLDTHQRVLEAGDGRHGASVHFVTEELDAGPVLLQGSIAVWQDDTPDTLAARLMDRVETRIYPQALDWLAHGRAELIDGQVHLDGRRLEEPIHVDCD